MVTAKSFAMLIGPLVVALLAYQGPKNCGGVGTPPRSFFN
jgi:hypothetical protein